MASWGGEDSYDTYCTGMHPSKSYMFFFLVIQIDGWFSPFFFKVHVLPREMLGRSTFGLSMWLLKWLPMSLVDRLLLIVSRLILGDTARYGLGRPSMGPLELKNLSGKTPVLDVGTLAKIKKGDIKVHTLVTCQSLRTYILKKILKKGKIPISTAFSPLHTLF